MRYLRQSTAVDLKIGPFLDATDGVTPETGLTISQADVRLAKNSGAWAQKNDANAATHEENGWYEVSLNTTDTNTLGVLMLAVTESGALPVWHEFSIVPANIWDSWFGADLQQVDTREVGGTTQTAKDIGGAVPAAAAGASGGLLISGSNAGTTTLGALTVTGALTVSAGMVITQSTVDGHGLSITGNGAGEGVKIQGGATGDGLDVRGGGTSGKGIVIMTTAGDGLAFSVNGGHGVVVAVSGTDKHGVYISGGSGPTSDGMRLQAGIGGVALNAPTITGNITGSLSGSVGSVTAAVTVGTNNDKTGYRLSATGVDDVWDEAVDGAITGRQAMRLLTATQGGKVSGAETTTVTIRDPADTTDRVVATVDADGNRTAVTLSL